MKPLIKSIGDIRKLTEKCRENHNKEYEALYKLEEAVSKAIGS